MTLTPVKKQKLPDSVANRLLEVVRSGELGPGGRLPAERTLAAQLGVSRASLRNALSRLELMGVLEVRQGDGTFIRAADTETLSLPFQGLLRSLPQTAQDLLEFRQILEPEAAALAAMRATSEQIASLRTCLEQQHVTATRGMKLSEDDLKFHALIAQMVGNTVILRVLETLQHLMQQLRTHTLKGDRPELTLQEHILILTAIEARDPAAARAAMAGHLATVVRTAAQAPQGPSQGEAHA
ncbi:FadR family transcriptional regulator (plasmid) [Deinococcus taeanensis]|uniref:FadR/GntR family transcriptional regulator n=1 Tax=Deinococcus taeanensis TaxID=2737050 RepID=UPI001CDC7DD6|nr:FadR/GntR family transcriptional regulator [Deinococcus taeanensis]UBV45318.1 FadR family transcriptional regulator [Deinococcus taeanensis]